jgi:hypothetical protein
METLVVTRPFIRQLRDSFHPKVSRSPVIPCVEHNCTYRCFGAKSIGANSINKSRARIKYSRSAYISPSLQLINMHHTHRPNRPPSSTTVAHQSPCAVPPSAVGTSPHSSSPSASRQLSSASSAACERCVPGVER